MHAKLKSSFRWFVYSDAGELGNFGEGFYFTFYTRLGQEAHHGSLWSEPLRAVLGCLRDGPGVSVCSQLRFCGSVFYLHVATSVFLCVFSEFLYQAFYKKLNAKKKAYLSWRIVLLVGCMD